jgi:hypothetical protein
MAGDAGAPLMDVAIGVPHQGTTQSRTWSKFDSLCQENGSLVFSSAEIFSVIRPMKRDWNTQLSDVLGVLHQVVLLVLCISGAFFLLGRGGAVSLCSASSFAKKQSPH